MDPIPNVPVINVRGNDISLQYIRPWMIQQPYVPNFDPVTNYLGFPIVDIPGCVETHPEENRKSQQLPNLVGDDGKSVQTLCPSGQYPSYNAMDYEPEQLIMTYEQKPPPVAPPPDPPETPSAPDTSKTNTKKDVECPGPNSPRIGDVAQNQTEKVSGFKLSDDGTTCIVLYEDIGVIEQYLPSAQVAATTGGIAVVATTSALLAKPLADLLLKVVKPLVKQVFGKVQKILGKTPYRPTPSQIRTNQYREKKGLLAINFAKKNQKNQKKLEKKG
tara:strand:+ start:156 stop:977 length:822 start_codon:yes stop_codon:yes gene_type:complete